MKYNLDSPTFLHPNCPSSESLLSLTWILHSLSATFQSVICRPTASVSPGSTTEMQDLRPSGQKLHFNKVWKLFVCTLMLKSNVPNCFILSPFQSILYSYKGDPLKLDHVTPLQNKTKTTPCDGEPWLLEVRLSALLWAGPILSNTSSSVSCSCLSLCSTQTLLFSLSHRSRTFLPSGKFLLPGMFSSSIHCKSSSFSSFSSQLKHHFLEKPALAIQLVLLFHYYLSFMVFIILYN